VGRVPLGIFKVGRAPTLVAQAVPVRRNRWHEEIDCKILRWVDLVSVESGDVDISDNVASIRKRPVSSRAGFQTMRRAAFARRS
jgi:hypothetical protein